MITGKRRGAVIGFAIFLAVLAVCTLVAKGLYTSGLSRVTVQSPGRKNISHAVNAKGVVLQGQEYGVYVEAGLRVGTVAVKAGDSFDAGDQLFQIDREDLLDVIAGIKLETASLRKQGAESADGNLKERRQKNLTLARAKEDYEKAVRDTDLAISRTRLILSRAQAALEEYQKKMAQSGQVSGGDSSPGGEEQLAERKRLEQAVLAANQAVEDAILAKRDNLQTAERSIEDARILNEYASQDADTLDLELQYKESRLQELEALKEQDGWVYAKEAGRVTSQKLTVGERTADSACMLYALDRGERLLQVNLTKEEAKYVSLGDTAQLSWRSGSGAKEQQDAVVEYLETSEDGSVAARLKLTDMDVVIGQNVDFRLNKISDPYDMCIPAGCLYQNSSGGYFVYTVEEQEGILGSQWQIRTMEVSVLDQNEQYAAIEGSGISRETRIVESYSKQIAQGDAVRLIE